MFRFVCKQCLKEAAPSAEKLQQNEMTKTIEGKINELQKDNGVKGQLFVRILNKEKNKYDLGCKHLMK